MLVGQVLAFQSQVSGWGSGQLDVPGQLLWLRARLFICVVCISQWFCSGEKLGSCGVREPCRTGRALSLPAVQFRPLPFQDRIPVSPSFPPSAPVDCGDGVQPRPAKEELGIRPGQSEHQNPPASAVGSEADM